MNHYEVLEVSQNASPDVIKAAYKSLMQRHHPDRNPGDAKAAERSLAVALAYEVLSDDSRRAEYDMTLRKQAAFSKVAEARVRHIVVSAERHESESSSRSWLWLLLLPAAMIGWLAFSVGKGGEPPEGGSSRSFRVQRSSEDGAKLGGAEKYMGSSQSRTIPQLFRDMQVALPPSSIDGVGCTLSVQSIGIVAGGFDSDKFLPFLEANKDYIQQKLAARLVTLNCAELMGLNGGIYLKQAILNSLDEITGTRQGEATSAAERYGVVEVLLPDSYSIAFR